MKRLLAVVIGFFWLFLHSQGWGQVVITEVFYDSPLEESMKIRSKVDMEGIHHNGEFIEIYNNSAVRIDLSGYSLRNMSVPAYETFFFPQGTFCDPNDFVIVAFRHPNSPEFKLKNIFKDISTQDERKILYHHSFILGNSGSTVVLRNRCYEIVSFMTTKAFDAHNGHRRTLSVHRIPSMANVYLSDDFGKVIQTEANPFGLCKSDTYFPLRMAFPMSQPNVSDRSKTVGEIKVDVSTTPTGAANLTIPLLFPPGISGFAPEMSVALNSQMGLGTMGIKAELTGLSAISRTQESVYFDGKNCPVKFQDGGPYALDGTRLVRSKDNNDLYETVPVHSFTRIEAIGRSGNGPVSFKVTSPDGMVAEYGEHESGRVYAKDGVDILAWKLTRITNPNGLSVDYRYQSDPELGNYLSEIRYKGLSDVLIEFAYIRNKYLPATMYVDGTFFKSDALLSDIYVYTECSFLDKYHFDYSDARLTRITESGMNGEKLSMDIGWGNARGLHSETTRKIEEKDYPIGVMFGDVNGDGRTDILQKCSDDGYIGFYFQKPDGTYGASPDQKITIYKEDRPSSEGRDGLRGFRVDDLTLVMDVDLDGTDELIFKRREEPGRDGFYNHTLNVCKYENGALKVTGRRDHVMSKNTSLFPVGFGQDGYVDLLLISDDGHYTYQGRDVAGQNNKIPVGWLNLKTVSTFDRDGYGKISILFYENSQWKIYDCDERRMLENVIPQKISGSLGGCVADVNGDGLADLVLFDCDNDSDQGYLHVMENKGGTFENYYTITINNFESWPYIRAGLEKVSCVAGDLNGDALMDLVLVIENKFVAEYGKRAGAYVLLKSADGSYKLGYQKLFDQESGIDCADLNSDGYFDLLELNKNSIKAVYYGESGKNLFNTVYNNGVLKATFDYALANDPGVHQLCPYNPQTPARCAWVSAYLVEAMHVPNGLGDMHQSDARITSNFKYYGGSYLNDGRGMLGFEKIEESYSSCGNENKTITEICYDPATWMPASQRISKYINAQLSGIGFTENQIKPMGDITDRRRARYALLPVGQCDSIFTDNSITSTKTAYDDFNRMVKQTVTYDDGSWVATENKGFSSFWQPLCTTETRKHYQDDAPFVSETRYTYDGHSNLKTRIDFSHTAAPVTTGYDYDGYGRVIRKTTAGNQVESKTETYAYDLSGCSLKTTTINPMGTTVSFYDPVTGNLEKESVTYPGISSAQTTTYGYDGMGRKVSEVRPDGTQWEKTFDWSGTGTGYFATTEGETGKPKVTSWYDVLGREIYSKYMHGSLQVEHAIIYNAVGQKLCELDGHSQKLSSTNYAYYPDGRLKSVITHVGKDAQYSYNGRITYVNENGRQFAKRLDSWGNVVEQTDPNGLKICHTYFSCGKPKSTSVGSHVVTMAYDVKGNRLRMHDPDIGDVSYTYDGYGRIKTYQDPKGGYTLQYDSWGNISRKAYTSGRTTDYVYNYSGNGIGSLQAIHTNYGVEQSFTYDAFGRVLTKREQLFDQVFTYSNTYDNVGRLLRHKTPDGYILNYTYDIADSRLMKVTDASSRILWQRLSDIPGIEISYKTGNGQVSTTTRSKDESECIIVLKDADGKQLHRNDYKLNPVWGNVISRTEKLNGLSKSESYYYDQLDRLTAVINYSAMVTSYDDLGNITQKNDVGKYLYESDRTHAVTGIEGPTDLMFSKPDQIVKYTEFNKVSAIRGGDYEMRFSYGPDEQRIKSDLFQNSTLIRTIYYGEGYEREVGKNGAVTNRTYLDADGSIFGMFVVMGGSAFTFHYYFHSDLLGSLVSISNSSGKIIESRSYDAWGRRRNPSDWEDYTNVPALKYSLRGYTFQEEMPEFGLVNLNGRLYDPLLGRMLSPDPYVQEPGMTQSYNRYSYCLNNPLKYTDTNGEFWHLIIGAVIGGIVNWGTHGAEFSWKGLAHFGIGAVSGALSAGIGSGISGVMGASINSGITFGKAFMSSSALLSTLKGGFVMGMASGAGSGFAGGLVSGTGSSLINGNSLGKSLSKGLLGGLIGGASAGVVEGFIAGFKSVLKGREFWDGSKIEDVVLADRKLPFVRQKGEYNCVAATAESVSRRKYSQDYIRRIYGGDANVNPITDSEALQYVADNMERTINNVSKNITGLDYVVGSLNDGADIVYNLGTAEPGHLVAINKVVYRTITKINDKVVYKTLYYIMNPAVGQYVRISESNLNTYINRFIIK